MPAKLGIQQTRFVSCCVISAHTQREKGGRGGRNIWQAGKGLALLSAEKELFLPKGEEGKAGSLPHTCPSGMGSSTHG